MNKKEMSEIKKGYKSDDKCYTNKILTVYVDAEKNILYNGVHPTVTMTVDERDVYDTTFLNVLSTSIGKKITEYAFPNAAYEVGNGQNVIYEMLREKLNSEEANTEFINHFVENFEYTGPYTLIVASCTYDIPHKDSMDEFDDSESDYVYSFLIGAVCPVDTSKDGFIFDNTDKAIKKKVNDELIIGLKPTDGFLYPTFSQRSPDINSIMIYSKSTSDLNISMVSNVFDCEFDIGADDQKGVFTEIIKATLGEDLTYNAVTYINDAIQDKININSNDTDALTIGSDDIEQIFTEMGVDATVIDRVKPVYNKICGTSTLIASNLVTHKTSLDIDDSSVTINIKPDSLGKIKTSNIDGRRCLIIDVDDNFAINGFNVNI